MAVRHFGEQQPPQQQLERMQEAVYQLRYHFFRKYLGGGSTVVDEGIGQTLEKAFYCLRSVSPLGVGYCLVQKVGVDQDQDRLHSSH